jgi:hypothetical protein
MIAFLLLPLDILLIALLWHALPTLLWLAAWAAVIAVSAWGLILIIRYAIRTA